MVQSLEAQALLARIAALPKEPGVDLSPVLQPSIVDETELRRLFATDRSNVRLFDPHVGLVDVFDAPPDIRTTRARVVKDEENLNAKYVLPLTEEQRRKDGEPCMVANLEEFKRNWNIFTEGSLSQLVDWNNVIAAGGSIQACLAPLADEDKVSKRTIRKYYHSAGYPSSDVDLFLWGLTPEQAEKKIVTIYEAVRDSVPWDVTCVRTKSTISIHSQYPYRSVQIVLRLYQSPAEVLAGFDIDAPCCAYDGTHVWANPRAIVAMMRQCNTTDVTRRSPSYEMRLAKYAKRGFEIYVPGLVRSDIDPTIFERSIAKIEGLARLLVLEKLGDPDRRHAFLESRRAHRGRPQGSYRRHRKATKKYKGDLKLDQMDQLEMNDYDVGSLHIPYGPGWDARRIDKLIYQTDLGMNSTFNPKNKGRRLHRHPAFFGTVQECMEDCCENCPEPVDDAERELQTEEDESYIRGRISFMQENPGRQILTGSFKPIDVGEWSAQVYVGPTERFFTAIAANDKATVADMIENGTDVNRRDHVGRSPLHFAIMCNATDIACDLIDTGARMTARLVDGRTSLHLAVQQDQVSVVRKLLEKSAHNKESAGIKDESDDSAKANEEQKDRASSDDDWSSEDDGVMEVDDEDEGADGGDKDDEENDKPAQDHNVNGEAEDASNDGIPVDSDDEPDIFDLAVADWDHGLTPIAYAVIFASLPILEDLIASGADVKESTKSTASDVHPLLLTVIRPDEDEACKIAERLILAGATSSPADSSFITVFWRIVTTGRAKLVSTILRCDPNANAVVNFPLIQWNSLVLPIILAIRARNYALVSVLLAYGAKLTIEEDDIARVLRTRPHTGVMRYNPTDLLSSTFLPVETAIARSDDLVRLLVALGAEVNVCIQECNRSYIQDNMRQTILGWVTSGIQLMEEKLEKERKEELELEPVELSKVTSWKEHAILSANLYGQPGRNMPGADKDSPENIAKLQRMESIKDYLGDVKNLLLSVGAKTVPEIKQVESQRDTHAFMLLQSLKSAVNTNSQKERTFDDYLFVTITETYYANPLPKYEIPRFHELFQACFDGDNEKIQALCLPEQVEESAAMPLQITVQLGDPNIQATYYNNKTGITPFSVAVANRKWETARLILAIASAQYEKNETEAQFSSDDIELDDDASDHESDCSDDSDMTMDQDTKDNSYVDISRQPSAIKCNVNPSKLLTTSRMSGHVFNNNFLRETPMDKAIRECDTEAFVKILNMVDAFSIVLEGVVDGLLDSIIHKDNAELLDELIRHTGVGIDLTVVRHETTGAIAINDSNRLYLGLNINGKKRTDLARKHDPDASKGAQQEFPLLWKALIGRAERIVDYLSSEKPYTAYRAYAMSHSDERAERLRKINKLKELLPQWLGFKVNALGESPLTAAVLSGNMEIVKVLFAKHKELMKAVLHEKWKPSNLNILQIAVRANNEPGTDLLDFFLAKNISPLDVDTNGHNIYHFLCSKNKSRLLKYFLEKLPAQVNKILLTQTGERLMTPLHFAAEKGALKAVEMILPHSNDATTMRDSNGNLPLHVAVLKSFPQITRLLINATPLALFMENGVGNTALETITTLRLQGCLATIHSVPGVERLTKSHVDDSIERFNLIRLEKELPLLHQTINTLTEEGRLRKDTKLYKELIAFADVMESHRRQLQQGPEIIKKLKENDYDQGDLDATHDSIQEVLKTIQGKRELVHLIDVQKSVDRNIVSVIGMRSAREWRSARVNERRRGLEKEETVVERSFVAFRIAIV